MDGDLPPGMAMDEGGHTMILAHGGTFAVRTRRARTRPECIAEAIAKGYR